ncbi:hypothetical protein ACQPZ8_33485 [Actinomadura nitritigenes]|uniref:hypothetical protein n=1 Tax=Actinomadura nitritigenes TaxID=134602 RepID=UPI003D90698A
MSWSTRSRRRARCSTPPLGLAESIAENAPLGLAAVKELVRLGVTDPARAAQRNKELQRSVFSREDAKEGAAGSRAGVR